MGKPDKKLKRILWIVGITGAVYGIFRYLLPLVVPFLMAWILALVLRPSALWLARRCRARFWIRGRQVEFAIPVGVIGVAELLIAAFLVSFLLYYGGCRLCMEAGLLLDQVPIWVESLDLWLTAMCHRLEECLCLDPDCLVLLMREMLRGMADKLKYAAMPYLMANSVSIFQWGLKMSVVSVILLVSVGLAIQEMETWKQRCQASLYRKEFSMVGHRLAVIANAYLKTQGIIMFLTTLICMAGFWVIQNPYYIILGAGIGILDALPVFGTGTVLVPWAVICFFRRQWGKGLLLLALYLVCYILREILEAKLMGNQVGLSALETLVSMYVGLELFGIYGLLLGPVGLLLVEDLVELWDGQREP
ncbi:AI-2E family transporter [Clostridiaceae bacterium]|nr:AI-2E family transporter [Clostridiaceae bacterium]RKI09216.1 AI-2E family transporter [bacterium 1XD21-70]